MVFSQLENILSDLENTKEVQEGRQFPYLPYVFVGNQSVSFIIPVDGEKDRFVISQGRTLTAITWDGVSDAVTNVEKLGEVEDIPETIDNQINDAKADPSGRLWFGTIKMAPIVKGDSPPKTAALYSFGPNKVIRKQVSGISISNGLAFNEALKKAYYIDSTDTRVYQFDFDVKNGTICKSKCIVHYRPQSRNLLSYLKDFILLWFISTGCNN